MNPRNMSGSSLGPKPPPRGEDLPCDDGEPLETKKHGDQMHLLIDSLNWAWSDRHDFFVGGNMFLYYSETQSKKNDYRGPDVFVVLDTSDHDRRSWVIWEEDGRAPNVIIEITSETTEHIDRGPKMRIYGPLLRVPFYAIFDPFTGQLDAYRYDADHARYEPIAKDERGYVRCEPMDVWLGVIDEYCAIYRSQGPWLRWIDNNGERLALPSEDATRLRAENDRLKNQ
jgi:Uma2 family endonuclease